MGLNILFADYLHSQRRVKKLDANVYVYNNDYIGAASFNIFVRVACSLMCTVR